MFFTMFIFSKHFPLQDDSLPSTSHSDTFCHTMLNAYFIVTLIIIVIEFGVYDVNMSKLDMLSVVCFEVKNIN